MYKLIKRYFADGSVNPESNAVMKDGYITIPFDPANTDYANFKLDLADGVEIQDADGNTMTAEEVAEFVATLP